MHLEKMTELNQYNPEVNMRTSQDAQIYQDVIDLVKARLEERPNCGKLKRMLRLLEVHKVWFPKEK